MKEGKARNRMYIHTEGQREAEIRDGDEDYSPRGSYFAGRGERSKDKLYSHSLYKTAMQ